jgi:hyaluronan synthase
MTTDITAAKPSTRFHDYRDLPGDEFYRAFILLGFGLVLFLSWRFDIFHGVVSAARHHQWGRFVVSPAILWAAMGMLMLLLRTLLWFRYRTPPLATMADAPPLTVIIPAYNEGEMVARSIESVVHARYPRERLEVVVVDDGSVDDTWQHIERIACRYPDLVTPLRFDRNRGKRAALEAGFRRGRGEIMITIDSDSVIDPETLLAMAGPFADPRVGAVAGKVSVFNRGDGLIPRMLKVRFALSFDFLRAVQSTYGTVYCCPGALAAYRTRVVRDVLDGWVGQRFLGRPCTYGEDRAMTNDILGQGYDCVYQRAGVVHTLVPTTYRRLCKMFLRWDRSYVREELRFLRSIVWRRPPKARDRAGGSHRHELALSGRVGDAHPARHAGRGPSGDAAPLLLRDAAGVLVQHALLPARRAALGLHLRHRLLVLLRVRAVLDLPVRALHRARARLADAIG